MKNMFNIVCGKCSSPILDGLATVWLHLTEDGTDADTSHDGNYYWDVDSTFHPGTGRMICTTRFLILPNAPADYRKGAQSYGDL